MLYQCNTLASISLLPFSIYLLVKYIELNYYSIVFWDHPSCLPDPGCINAYINGRPRPLNETVLQYIREKHLDPPPTDPKTGDFNIYTPVWRKLVDWIRVQENLKDVFQDQKPGFFVEIGAVDGHFMSQTLYLEKNLSWTGLLIEPDPRSYKMLQQAKRNAYLSDLCVAEDILQTKYWIRPLEEDLPFHFQQLMLARSKTFENIMVGDEERGLVINVMCVPLKSILMAGNFTHIDMLTIATGNEDDNVMVNNFLQFKKVNFRTILVQYPISKLYTTSYPEVDGYILDMGHSELLTKFYVKRSECKLIQKGTCKDMKYYDLLQACEQYFCFDYLSVWTYSENTTPKPPKA